jgi:Flp pilus assembly protein TadG
MKMRTFLSALRRDTTGGPAIEFALLAPVFIAGLIGVVQAGWGYQNYSAMRQLSADAARYTMINYGAGNRIDNATLGTYFTGKASASPYLLEAGSVTVTDAATQRYSGVTEKTITVNAQVASLFVKMGIKAPAMTYSQPIFVPTT